MARRNSIRSTCKRWNMSQPGKPRFDSVKAAKDLENLGDRLKVMLEADDKAAKLVQALTFQGFQYASSIIPEVADTAKPIDDAMRWGFMHEAGPVRDLGHARRERDRQEDEGRGLSCRQVGGRHAQGGL